MSASDVIFHARQCLRTPFHHQGRQPGIGIDCAGLIIHAFREAGYRVTDDARYSRNPQPGRMREVMERIVYRENEWSEWQPADILYFRIVHDPQHLALWTGSSIIHAYLTAGKVVEQGLDETWKRRLVARYRHPGLIGE